MNMRYLKSGRARSKESESGYVLLAVMLTLTLMLIALSVEAPRIAQQIKRDKEEELIHRGKDYATAVKRFVHKNGGRYPASIEQLENTNHVRFLRKKYVDPMTGESDWKMVHVGEAEIKIPAPNPNGNQSGPTGTLPTSSPSLGGGSTGGGGTASGGGGTGGGGTANGGGGTGDGGTGTLQTSNIGNGPTIGGGQIMGVASVSKKHGIKEFNDKDEYDQWYFVYDPRLEPNGGSGVTVAAPRAGGSATGSSGGSKNPDAQPTPVQTPAPTPTPQN
jgi:type II secretory pathway pseudopilin PulG